MLSDIQGQPPDPILALAGLFRADARPKKLDLGVGVFRDAEGHTPIMAAVKEAEHRLLRDEATKTYVGTIGSEPFLHAVRALLLGDAVDVDRIAGMQTPGGSSALRCLADLAAVAKPGATIWISDPTWSNHAPVFRAAGLRVATYPYFDPSTAELLFPAMMAALEQAAHGDILLLHGCCHNPTGADLDAGQWESVTELLVRRGLVPFVDIAYQGLGAGLEADAGPLRNLLAHVPEAFLATSCSKNFGLYRDRVGAAFVVCADSATARRALSEMMALVRANYSMPPDHGAAVVSIVLHDDTLRAMWRDELESMRVRIAGIREKLGDALAARQLPSRFRAVASQRGMFSLLGFDAELVTRLREQYACYVVPGGRINVAGFRDDARIEQFADILVDALRSK